MLAEQAVRLGPRGYRFSMIEELQAMANRRDFLAATGVALAGSWVSPLATAAEKTGRTVDAATKPGQPWKAYPTRTLEDVPALAQLPVDANLDAYGGLKSRTSKATGFFRAEKIQGRWWLIDPDGGLFLHKGIATVGPLKTPGAIAAMKEKFGNESGWANQTTALLRQHGFNGAGAWCDADRLAKVETPLVTTRIWNFMSTYGRKRGGVTQQSGHAGYPHDAIFVFDPAFETFCDEHARQLEATRDDKSLLGHFSDNELPLRRTALTDFLALDEKEAGNAVAREWLQKRHGVKATAKDAKDQDQLDFLGVVAERYFNIVSKAIRKHDPNHLYLGSRFHGQALRLPVLFEAAGKHVDVVSVNYYGAWTPDQKLMAEWEQKSTKPFMITEWYTKGEDSGMKNTTGAGWLVKTQKDRGQFYQNYTLALLECKACVGWHWFKYADNDPTDTKADPSNLDSNKGIVTARYEPYQPLLEAMKQLNDRAYGIIAANDRNSK